jgi:hypothetical protein
MPFLLTHFISIGDTESLVLDLFCACAPLRSPNDSLRSRGHLFPPPSVRLLSDSEHARYPRFLDNLDSAFASVLRSRRNSHARHLSIRLLYPPQIPRILSAQILVSELYSMAFAVTVYASHGRSSFRMQDSFPVVCQTLPGWVVTSKVNYDRFQNICLFPFPSLILAQISSTFAIRTWSGGDSLTQGLRRLSRGFFWSHEEEEEKEKPRKHRAVPVRSTSPGNSPTASSRTSPEI